MNPLTGELVGCYATNGAPAPAPSAAAAAAAPVPEEHHQDDDASSQNSDHSSSGSSSTGASKEGSPQPKWANIQTTPFPIRKHILSFCGKHKTKMAIKLITFYSLSSRLQQQPMQDNATPQRRAGRVPPGGYSTPLWWFSNSVDGGRHLERDHNRRRKRKEKTWGKKRDLHPSVRIGRRKFLLELQNRFCLSRSLITTISDQTRIRCRDFFCFSKKKNQSLNFPYVIVKKYFLPSSLPSFCTFSFLCTSFFHTLFCVHAYSLILSLLLYIHPPCILTYVHNRIKT